MKITDLQGYTVVKTVPSPVQEPTSTTLEQPQERGFLNRAAGAISNFVGARGIVEQYGASLARTKLKLEGNIEASKLVENPTLKEVTGSALQTGANFIPGAGKGAALGVKVGLGAATGYAMDVGSDLQQNKSISDASKPGAATFVGAGLPLVSKTISSIIGKTPKEMEKLNLRLTPVEQQKLKQSGKDITGFLAKKKIVGTPQQRLQKVYTLYKKYEVALDKKLAGSNIAFTKDELTTALSQIPNEFADDPVALQDVTKKVKHAIDFVDNVNGSAIDVHRVNKIKRAYFKRAYGKNQTDVVSDAYHAIGSTFKRLMDDGVPGLDNFNREYGNVLVARKLLNKAVTRNQAGLITRGIGATVGGTVGNGIAGPGGAAAGAIIGDQAANRVATPIRSAVGASAQSIIDIVDKLPVDKAGNISKKALLQALSGN